MALRDLVNFGQQFKVTFIASEIVYLDNYDYTKSFVFLWERFPVIVSIINGS